MSNQETSRTEITGGVRIFSLADLHSWKGKDVELSFMSTKPGPSEPYIGKGRVGKVIEAGLPPEPFSVAIPTWINPDRAPLTIVVEGDDLKSGARLIMREVTPNEIQGLILSHRP